MSASDSVERYCSQCGRSIVPLNVPHLSAECADCGKTIHFVRTAPNGVGIQVEKGERFSIPAGFIQLSLDPRFARKAISARTLILTKAVFYRKPS